MICLSLVAAKLEANKEALSRYRQWVGMAELRLDRLTQDQYALVPEFVSSTWENLGIPFILTARLPADGGSWAWSEDQRQKLLLSLVQQTRPGALAWVDLEQDVLMPELEEAVLRSGAGLIYSLHDFSATPVNLYQVMTTLYRKDSRLPKERQMAKAAVMIRDNADLLTLVKTSKTLKSEGRKFILAGMGPAGVPSRILADALGSYLTFTSPALDGHISAAPGHMDPELLATGYHYGTLNSRTALFGIIGNPVMHSKSPAYHNQRFYEAHQNAVYVPFQVEKLDCFMELARELDLKGFSVTIPHKEAVCKYLESFDNLVPKMGACNTVLHKTKTWYGCNTDAPGFLNPLLELGQKGRPLPKAALVLGAGGAARAVIQALLSIDLEVLIVNRSLERALGLCRLFDRWYPGKVKACSVADVETQDVSRYQALVVQTTSAGMEGAQVSEDPGAFLEYTGHEILYDIVYTPEKTVFLARGEAAGCTILNGKPMFLEQARLQSELFLGSLKD